MFVKSLFLRINARWMANPSLENAREQLLRGIMLTFAILGLPVIISNSVAALNQNRPLIVVLFIAVYLLVLFSVIFPGYFSHRWKSNILSLVLFVRALSELRAQGPNHVSFPILLTLFALSTLLVNFRTGVTWIGIALLAIGVMAVLQISGRMDIDQASAYLLVDWVIAGATLLLLAMAIVIPLGLIQTFFRHSTEELHKQINRTQREKEFYEALANNSPIAIASLNREKEVNRINPAFEGLFGYSNSEAVGRMLDDLIANELIRAESIALTNQIMAGATIRETARRANKQGDLVDVEIFGVPVTLGGVRIGALALYTDISERVQIESEIKEKLFRSDALARTDSMTGLQNRRAIMEQAEAEFNRSQRHNTALCMMVIDIDRFKGINDSHGHQVGDRAIVHVASLLTIDKRAYDQLGRWGGDEFLMVLPNCNLLEADVVAQRLCQSVADSALRIDNENTLELSISIGVACVTEESRTTGSITKLFTLADRAMYGAKQRGGGQVFKSTDLVDEE